jgi:hypothetical protein
MISANVEFQVGDVERIESGISDASLDGLRLGGELILQLSRNRVPIEEGTLERSGMVTDDGKETVAVSYDTPYARRQHEDMSMRHDAGRSAKYLELAVAESRQDVLAIVAEQVRRGMTG